MHIPKSCVRKVAQRSLFSTQSCTSTTKPGAASPIQMNMDLATTKQKQWSMKYRMNVRTLIRKGKSQFSLDLINDKAKYQCCQAASWDYHFTSGKDLIPLHDIACWPVCFIYLLCSLLSSNFSVCTIIHHLARLGFLHKYGPNQHWRRKTGDDRSLIVWIAFKKISGIYEPRR